MPGDSNVATKPKTAQATVVEQPKIESVKPQKIADKMPPNKPDNKPKIIETEPLKISCEPPKKVDVSKELKLVFSNIEKLCKEMYDNVFSKNEQFRPTYIEAIKNTLAYLAFKCKECGVYNEFDLAFEGVEISNINELFVPYIIKLSTWYDKKFNKDITQKLLFEFKAFFKILSKNLDFTELNNFIQNN